jgi:eukaryotic-like serine/threonine-protein kinase
MSQACPRCGLVPPQGRLEACPRCLLEADLAPPLLGESLELIEEVGRGGMGHVWKARHRRLSRLVAVKFLAEPLAAQSDAERRFEREAQVLARLNHPGIVAVHDFGREGDRGYLVMEYVEGAPLSAALPLPPARAHAVALEVLAALAAAHRAGVVHRDVKPANILLDGGGHAKVTDFGLARLQPGRLDSAASTTQVRVAGTPRYMAPEVLTGAAPDPRQDVFAMGVVLHEMLTGEPAVARSEPLPAPFEAVARRALAPDPARRYADAGEMHEALAASAVGDGSLTTLPPHEWNWLRAVALLQTLATAVALWALLLAITPKVIGPGDVQPLIMLGTETLADGRIVSRARFETWPTLAAVGAIVLALAAYGTLRRHWREAGLDTPRPAEPVPTAYAVLGWSAIALVLYVTRHWLGGLPAGLTPYVPILGGLLELAMLFLTWITILEARRRSRPLHREAALWAGVALALVPPARDLLFYLQHWRP